MPNTPAVAASGEQANVNTVPLPRRPTSTAGPTGASAFKGHGALPAFHLATVRNGFNNSPKASAVVAV